METTTDADILRLERQCRELGIEVMRQSGGWIIADTRGHEPRYRGAGSLWRTDPRDVNIMYRHRLQAVQAADAVLTAEEEES